MLRICGLALASVLLLVQSTGAAAPAARPQSPQPQSAQAQSPRAQAPASKLALEAVEVEPKTAKADTLCRLRARIRNGGDAIASGLVFRVKLDGRELGVYRDQIFLDPIAPGETRAIPLYSFWTTESTRPAPADGTIDVEVSLIEARWTRAEKDADGTLVWSDLGEVEGLPLVATYALELGPSS
jgi:hypothetical protein